MQRTKGAKSVRPVSSRWMPELWASPKLFGLGEQHSNNFWGVFRAIWENRDQLPYAYRILNDGVCDGSSLGTSGMTDWTMNSIHLCNIRLRLRSPLAKIPAYKEFWASVESAQATVGLESAAAKSESSNYWVRSTGTCWDVWSAVPHNTLRSVKDSRKSEKVRCFAIRGGAGTYHVKETVRLD